MSNYPGREALNVTGRSKRFKSLMGNDKDHISATHAAYKLNLGTAWRYRYRPFAPARWLQRPVEKPARWRT